MTVTAGVRPKGGPSEPAAVETRPDRDGRLEAVGRSRELVGPATGADVRVTTGPPAVESAPERIGHPADRVRGADSSRADGLVISATAIPGAAGRPTAAGPRGPDVTAMAPRATVLVPVVAAVGGSVRTAAVPGSTVVGRAAVGVRTLQVESPLDGDRSVRGVIDRPEATTDRPALNARTAETVVRTQRVAEGTPKAMIAGGVTAVSVTATVSGLGVRRPVVGGVT
ncbi:hypothetical protein, partial [Actinopolymorpha rutila]